MKIQYSNHTPTFKSNIRSYRTDNDKVMPTMTYLFRDDLDWKNFTNFIVKHFKNKEKIQFLQFASSDGSEAYTQIISLLENHYTDAKKFLPIQAYDIDKEVVDAAKSGLLNLTEDDRLSFPKNSKSYFSHYFSQTDKELWINNDCLIRSINGVRYPAQDAWLEYKTYAVNKILKDNVIFNQKDMFDVLLKHQDNSDTIILCKNVLMHLSKKQINYFTDLLQRKLAKNSILVVGNGDIPKAVNDNDLLAKGFEKVFKNVYKKIDCPTQKDIRTILRKIYYTKLYNIK